MRDQQGVNSWDALVLSLNVEATRAVAVDGQRRIAHEQLLGFVKPINAEFDLARRCEQLADSPLIEQPPGVDDRDAVAELFDFGEQMA